MQRFREDARRTPSPASSLMVCDCELKALILKIKLAIRAPFQNKYHLFLIYLSLISYLKIFSKLISRKL
jgi:hypothetical protein